MGPRATYQKHSELVHPFTLRGRPWEEISVQRSSLQKAVPDYLRHVYIEGTDVAPTLLLPQGRSRCVMEGNLETCGPMYLPPAEPLLF